MTDETGRFRPAIGLAHEADFQLGSLLVIPSAREVVRQGARETLEPRVIQVLVALFQAQGRVVSRDELIARCWEGRIVGEDAINRAIGRLRRLSEADGEASFRLETIPRVGFRLIPSETKSGEPQANAPSVPGPIPPLTSESGDGEPALRHSDAHKGTTRSWLIGAAVGLAVMAGGMLAWHLWSPTASPRWAVQSSRPFIESLALEDYPAFSPNGGLLAYASGDAGAAHKIYLHNLAGGEAVRLTNDPYDDVSPSWSSDGARIVYIGRQAGVPCHIMVTTVPAGQSREAGRCQDEISTTITWQPGTSFAYFVERRGLTDAIYRLDLDSGSEILIAQTRRVNQLIYTPICSPDGKSLAYLERGRGIILRNLATGSERLLDQTTHLNDEIWLAWSSNSQAVFATISGDAGSEIRVYPLQDGAQPYSIYSSALRLGRLAIGGQQLALETDISRVNLARVTHAPDAQADLLEAANGYSWSPTYAPDGTLAFLSNRSGTNAVWIMKAGTSTATQLYDGGFAHLYKVSYSPDGSQLALVTETDSGVNIKLLSPAGASIQSFDMPSLGLGLPTWSPDGKALLVFDRRDTRTWRIEAANPLHRTPIAPPHWVGVAIRKEGTIAMRADKPGIWRIDGPVRQIDQTYPAFDNSTLAFQGSDVLVPQYVIDGTPRLLAQPLAGGAGTLAGYAPGAINQADFQSSFAVDPRNGQVIYSAMVGRDTNIDLLTLAKRQ